MPNMPTIPYPLKLQQTDKKAALDRAGEENNEVKMNFILRGGYDKVSLHITPLNGFALRNWSFTDIDVKKFGRRNTYFVFLSYGAEPPKQREFSIQLQYVRCFVLLCYCRFVD
ncbi:unnamed protein product [Anisakis simplex]|uniref:MSP domain-containing protein n=1 Tax=Anisakis simplex TaxID=6269 RepID=A0A0M3JM33_ANISI|nr:unnamed protein product [Anisakis simplex]